MFAPQPVFQPIGTQGDDALANGIQNEAANFATLYRLHLPQVYRYLLARVGNVADAQDLTSETFLAAMQAFPTYRAERPFVAWLLGIARHKIADHFRRGHAHVNVELTEEIADQSDGLEGQVNDRLTWSRIQTQLSYLSPDRAEAVSLRLFAGLDAAEIAGLMGKRETAVRMLIFRGMRDLREQLSQTR
jgi:RNA polymerase sigma-70 factor (ECF subfamily)